MLGEKVGPTKKLGEIRSPWQETSLAPTPAATKITAAGTNKTIPAATKKATPNTTAETTLAAADTPAAANATDEATKATTKAAVSTPNASAGANGTDDLVGKLVDKAAGVVDKNTTTAAAGKNDTGATAYCNWF